MCCRQAIRSLKAPPSSKHAIGTTQSCHQHHQLLPSHEVFPGLKKPLGSLITRPPVYCVSVRLAHLTMDYSTTSNPFTSSAAFSYGTNSMFGNSTATSEELNKSKLFNNWHSRQGIAAPQDYPMFANQPAPFSSVPQNPNVPTAASPYIQKIMALQPAEPKSLMVCLCECTFVDGQCRGGGWKIGQIWYCWR